MERAAHATHPARTGTIAPSVQPAAPPLSLTEELLWAKADFRRRLQRLDSTLARARHAVEAAAIQRQIRRLEVEAQLGYLRIQAEHARRLALADVVDLVDAAESAVRGARAAGAAA